MKRDVYQKDPHEQRLDQRIERFVENTPPHTFQRRYTIQMQMISPYAHGFAYVSVYIYFLMNFSTLTSEVKLSKTL